MNIGQKSLLLIKHSNIYKHCCHYYARKNSPFDIL